MQTAYNTFQQSSTNIPEKSTKNIIGPAEVKKFRFKASPRDKRSVMYDRLDSEIYKNDKIFNIFMFFCSLSTFYRFNLQIIDCSRIELINAMRNSINSISYRSLTRYLGVLERHGFIIRHPQKHIRSSSPIEITPLLLSHIKACEPWRYIHAVSPNGDRKNYPSAYRKHTEKQGNLPGVNKNSQNVSSANLAPPYPYGCELTGSVPLPSRKNLKEVNQARFDSTCARNKERDARSSSLRSSKRAESKPMKKSKSQRTRERIFTVCAFQLRKKQLPTKTEKALLNDLKTQLWGENSIFDLKQIERQWNDAADSERAYIAKEVILNSLTTQKNASKIDLSPIVGKQSDNEQKPRRPRPIPEPIEPRKTADLGKIGKNMNPAFKAMCERILNKNGHSDLARKLGD